MKRAVLAMVMAVFASSACQAESYEIYISHVYQGFPDLSFAYSECSLAHLKDAERTCHKVCFYSRKDAELRAAALRQELSYDMLTRIPADQRPLRTDVTVQKAYCS